MKTCPTGAIRIREGKAVIRKEWCVDCAECLRVCPVTAIYVEQSDFDDAFSYPCRVVLMPAVFLGQFSDTTSEADIYDAIYKLGFTHICPVEISVDVIHSEMTDQISGTGGKPAISPFCPAIVRLLQVRYPGLVDNILNVKSPVEATAMLYRKQLLQEGYTDDEIGMFYVTPCSAKIASLREDNEYGRPLIDGVVNMNFFYNKVRRELKANSGKPSGGKVKMPPPLTRDEMSWSLTSGEADNFAGRCFAVDEIHNVIDFIERMETSGEIDGIDFLELRACDRGCVGGILAPVNRFQAADRLHELSELKSHQTALYNTMAPESVEYMIDNICTEKYRPNAKLDYEGDIDEVLRKMDMEQKILDKLPGIDCGACGSPRCKSLAQDILRGEANFDNCVFMQREMEKSGALDSERARGIVEKVWGSRQTGKKGS